MEKLDKYRYKLIIEYDGNFYNGFQAQFENNLKTVEQSLVIAINKFSQSQISIYACGRTDSGVHALGQVIHVDLPTLYDSHKLIMGINYYLKNEAIAILDAKLVDNNFHARFKTIKRNYQYIILNRQAVPVIDKNRLWHIGGKKLDITAMIKASKFLEGQHDFSAFRDKECQAKSPIKTIDNIEIYKINEKIYINISAKSFLHHMVRNIVGTLVWVGKNKISPDDILKILESIDRTKSGPNAPANGLYLVSCEY